MLNPYFADKADPSSKVYRLFNQRNYLSLRFDSMIEHYNDIKHLKFSTLEQLYLAYNQSAVLIIISDVIFPSLKILRMNNNQISSIEALASLYMPFICEINLSHNNITTIKAIRKIRSRHLTQVYMDNNFIYDYQPILCMNTQKYSISIGNYQFRMKRSLQFPLKLPTLLEFKTEEVHDAAMFAMIPKKWPYFAEKIALQLKQGRIQNQFNEPIQQNVEENNEVNDPEVEQ